MSDLTNFVEKIFLKSNLTAATTINNQTKLPKKTFCVEHRKFRSNGIIKQI